jgi:hypothetical protein
VIFGTALAKEKRWRGPIIEGVRLDSFDKREGSCRIVNRAITRWCCYFRWVNGALDGTLSTDCDADIEPKNFGQTNFARTAGDRGG